MSGHRLRRIFLVGWYGVDNVGDDAIRLAVERAATSLGAEVQRYAVRRPVDDPRAVRLRGRDWRAYIAAIRSSDRVALGGGGLLKDERHAGSQGYGVLVELLATALLARAFGKQVVLLAMGVGPIRTHRGRWLIHAVARLAAVRQVRDHESAWTLQTLGIGRVEVGADPTFSFLADTTPPAGPATGASPGKAPAAPEPSPAANAIDLGVDPNHHALLSVRHWFTFEPDRELREGALQAAFASAADALARSGGEPRFANLYWPRDHDASESVIARMTAPARSLGGPLSWDELARELRDARLLVAMRYHAIACAAISGCPVVPVAYEPKVVALARALGLPHLHVDDPDLKARLTELTRAALTDPDAHRPDPERLRELSTDAWVGLRRVLG